MVSIARKNLLHDRTRLAVSAGGVGFAMMLILILAATYDGFDREAGLYMENAGADLYVAQVGLSDSFHSFSIVPLNVSAQLEAIPDVERVCAVISRTVDLAANGVTKRAIVVGYNETHGTGAAWRVIEGPRLPGPGEITIDRTISTKMQLSIGSTVEVSGRGFRVASISEETNVFILQYAFVRFSEASGLILPPATATAFFVKVAPGADIAAVAEEIESRIPGVDAFTIPEMVANNRKFASDAFLPILLVLYLIGFVIGIIVVGLTIYTATIERTKEFGVLKAIGAGNRALIAIVLQQSLLVAVLGFLVGLGVTAGTAFLIDRLVPEMSLYFRTTAFLWTLAAAVGMSAIASTIPLRRIARVDPASIFRRG